MNIAEPKQMNILVRSPAALCFDWRFKSDDAAEYRRKHQADQCLRIRTSPCRGCSAGQEV